MLKVLGAACAATLLAGCATTYAITPQAAGGEEVRYVRGTATVTSHKPNSTVAVSPLGISDKGRFNFLVVVYNKTGAPLNFGYENLAMARADAQPIALLGHNTLVRQAKNEATWTAVGLAVSSAASAYAAQQAATSTYTSSTYGRVGGTTYSGTTTAQIYNPAVAYRINQANAADTAFAAAMIEQNLDARLASISGTILQTHTVDPGESFGGQVVANRVRYPETLGLTVTVAGDVHQFRFSVAPER